MGLALLGSSVIGGIGGLIGGNSQAKAAEKAAAATLKAGKDAAKKAQPYIDSIKYNPVDAPERVDVMQAATDARNFNYATIDDILQRAPGINEQRVKQFFSLLDGATPGGSENRTLASQQIASALKGELPADVQRQLGSQAATMAFKSGSGRSNAQNLSLASLGLNSLSRIDQGINFQNQQQQTYQNAIQNTDITNTLLNTSLLSADGVYNARSQQSANQYNAALTNSQNLYQAGAARASAGINSLNFLLGNQTNAIDTRLAGQIGQANSINNAFGAVSQGIGAYVGYQTSQNNYNAQMNAQYGSNFQPQGYPQPQQTSFSDKNVLSLYQ